MMLFAFILSCIAAGAFACSDDHCRDRSLEDEVMAVKMLPNKEQMRTLCPKVLTFLECEKDYMECPGESLEELALSSDKEKSTMAKAMLSGMRLVRDICDEDSSIHQDYVESVDCFRGFVRPALRMCKQHVEDPIEKFFLELYPTEPTDDDANDKAFAEIRCMSDTFEIACLIDNLENSCGSVAQRTAMTVLERIAPVVIANNCGYLENAADLKSKFLDFLELEDEKRSKYQSIFDLLKRRR